MTPRALPFAVALVASLFASACSGGSGGALGAATTESAVEPVRKACLRTACDDRTARDADDCRSCREACLNYADACDPMSHCDRTCTYHPCSGTGRSACAQEGYEIDLPAGSSAELYGACDAVRSHVESCGLQVNPNFDCSRASRVERPELAQMYTCTSQLPCDTKDWTSCDTLTSDLGDKLCDAMSTACPDACDQPKRDSLNEAGVWLRNDVIALAWKCAAQTTCSDKHDCIAAWQEAIGPY